MGADDRIGPLIERGLFLNGKATFGLCTGRRLIGFGVTFRNFKGELESTAGEGLATLAGVFTGTLATLPPVGAGQGEGREGSEALDAACSYVP